MCLKAEVDWLLENAKFKFSSTMQRTPHSYTLREHWDSGKFDSVVRFIRQNGVVERFYRAKYIYYYLGDYKYWTMGNPINETKLINRAKHDTSYGFLRNKAIL